MFTVDSLQFTVWDGTKRVKRKKEKSKENLTQRRKVRRDAQRKGVEDVEELTVEAPLGVSWGIVSWKSGGEPLHFKRRMDETSGGGGD